MKEYFFMPCKSASSPYINHFLQPDTIIPDYTNPQAFNRYSYVLNKPVNFNDPTGHCSSKGDDWCFKENGSGISSGNGGSGNGGNGGGGGRNSGDACTTLNCLTGSDSGSNVFAGNGDWVGGIPLPSNIFGSNGSNWSLSSILTNITIGLDTISAGVSFLEATAADFLIVGGVTTGQIPEALVGDYYIASSANPIGAFEDWLGYASFGLTAISDGLSHYSYITSTGNIYIGKDTIVAGRNALLGIWPESNFDAAVSASQLKYDMDRLNGIRSGGSTEVSVSNDWNLAKQIIWQDSPFQDLFNIFR